jgi:FixJ family two-component response regulator
MRELEPRIGVIIVSGYLDPSLRDEMIQEGAIAFLRKPYTAQRILRAIRKALDAKSAVKPRRKKR